LGDRRKGESPLIGGIPQTFLEEFDRRKRTFAEEKALLKRGRVPRSLWCIRRFRRGKKGDPRETESFFGFDGLT